MPARSVPRTLLLVLSSCCAASAAFCSGSPSPSATPNVKPIDKAPTREVRRVRNAVLQKVGTGEDAVALVHVWGSAYERGFAQGALMKADVQAFFKRAFDYFEATFESALNKTVPWVPEKVAHWVAGIGLGAALDATHLLTAPYTGAHFEDEMRGLADGADVPLQLIRRVHMIGELTK